MRLSELSIAEVTTRRASDLINIQPSTAAPSYHKIIFVIECYLSIEADDLCDGEVELNEIYFSDVRKDERC